jgi:hypothetical protein
MALLVKKFYKIGVSGAEIGLRRNFVAVAWPNLELKNCRTNAAVSEWEEYYGSSFFLENVCPRGDSSRSFDFGGTTLRSGQSYADIGNFGS